VAERLFLFAYGSLVARAAGLGRAPGPRGFLCDLPGHERWWGVAMDNRADLPGYKHYVTRVGERPDVAVAFLDIRPRPGRSVNGACLPLDPADLAALDARERNYERVDVTALLPGAPGRVFAFAGSAAGRERLAEALRSGRAVRHAGYEREVAAAFAALGPGEARRMRAGTAPAPCPSAELERVDAPRTLTPGFGDV
jgi:hypothetical protein